MKEETEKFPHKYHVKAVCDCGHEFCFDCDAIIDKREDAFCPKCLTEDFKLLD